MKQSLLLFFITLFSFSAVARKTISVRTKVNTGVGVQEGRLKNVYGIGGAFESGLKKVSGLKFTARADFGINGIKKMPYELRFNGSVTNTNVHYTSYVIQLASGFKYVMRDNKGWSPYVGLSAGILNYYTSMAVEDPNDRDGCSPIETKPVSYSMVFAGSGEAGLRIRPKQRGKGSVAYLEIGTEYIAGTKGRYLRLGSGGKNEITDDSYLMKFRQNSTGLEHEHRMGTMYRTTTSQLAYHFALVFRL